MDNITELKVTEVQANEYNPNVVPEHIMEQLKKDIQREGIQHPVTVRKAESGEGYIIIDGEHRWRTAQDLGLETIPCIIKDKNEHEAMLETINMNRLRGEFDSIKLAKVLNKLQEVYTMDDIQDLIGFTEEELANYETLVNLDVTELEDIDSDLAGEIIAGEDVDAAMLNEFAVQVDLVQLDIIETALAEKGEDKAKGIVDLCRKFLIENAPDKYEEVKARAKGLKEASDGSTPIPEEGPDTDSEEDTSDETPDSYL